MRVRFSNPLPRKNGRVRYCTRLESGGHPAKTRMRRFKSSFFRHVLFGRLAEWYCTRLENGGHPARTRMRRFESFTFRQILEDCQSGNWVRLLPGSHGVTPHAEVRSLHLPPSYHRSMTVGELVEFHRRCRTPLCLAAEISFFLSLHARKNRYYEYTGNDAEQLSHTEYLLRYHPNKITAVPDSQWKRGRYIANGDRKARFWHDEILEKIRSHISTLNAS